jgi:opacity protein-like surface antigen
MFFDYGKVDAGVPVVGGVVDTEVDGEGIGLGIALMGDFAPQLSGVARLGVLSNKTKVRGSGLGLTVSDSDRKAQPYLGLGVSYALTPQWKIDGSLDFTRLEFQNEKANVQMLMIGVTYGF